MPDEKTDTNLSNVLKLHLLGGGAIDNQSNAIPGQTMLYIRGIGGVTSNPLQKFMRFFGGNLKQQTRPMKKMLTEVYEKGDSLYIIGFSRGAAAARRFVSDLDKKGITLASGEVVKPEVEFLGCFETVSQQLCKYWYRMFARIITNRIVNPIVLGEKDGKMSKIVKMAVHNLALDDNRNRFGLTKVVLPQPNPPVFMDSGDSRVHEAWFPGEHGDVGGTYWTKGLPDASFKHMQEFMEELGIKFIDNMDIKDESLKIKKFPKVDINKEYLNVAPDPSDRTHLNEWQQNRLPSYRPVITVTDGKPIEGGTVRIHKSVLDHMRDTEKKGIAYNFNPRLRDANIVVVGSLDKELETETEALKELLEQ